MILAATNLAARRDAPVLCRVCGRRVERAARQQLYCSRACRERGKERVRKASLGDIPERHRTPQKNPTETMASEGQKRGRAPRRTYCAKWSRSRSSRPLVATGAVVRRRSRGRSVRPRWSNAEVKNWLEWAPHKWGAPLFVRSPLSHVGSNAYTVRERPIRRVAARIFSCRVRRSRLEIPHMVAPRPK
jgi:hypothetical protein